jgi:uncharacterized iron-regulated protein
MKHLCLSVLLLCSFVADQPAYRIFDRNGKPADYADLLNRAARADIVLFGEMHNNPICHWLQNQLTRDLYARKRGQITLGAEMFETDNQAALTDFVTGQTTANELAERARLWPNYDTDYRPLVEYAREQHIPFVATNVPRRYATLVARYGLTALDTLPPFVKKQMTELPLEVDLTLPGYRNMLTMMDGSTRGGTAHTELAAGRVSSGSNPHSGTMDMMAANFARAQALKDATMAQFIYRNWTAGRVFLHLNGAYHSNNFEGIVWYLNRQEPKRNPVILTISSVDVQSLDKLDGENRGLADFTIATPANMTKTY